MTNLLNVSSGSRLLSYRGRAPETFSATFLEVGFQNHFGPLGLSIFAHRKGGFHWLSCDVITFQEPNVLRTLLRRTAPLFVWIMLMAHLYFAKWRVKPALILILIPLWYTFVTTVALGKRPLLFDINGLHGRIAQVSFLVSLSMTLFWLLTQLNPSLSMTLFWLLTQLNPNLNLVRISHAKKDCTKS